MKCNLLLTTVLLSGCVTKATVPLPVHIQCPSDPPPKLKELPERPADLRKLEADRHTIEGLWEAFNEKQEAYTESWNECPTNEGEV